MLKDISKDKLERLVKKSSSISMVLRKLGYGVSGDNPKKLRAMIEDYGIDISHFKKGNIKKKTDKEIFRLGSVVSQSTLRYRYHNVCDSYVCDECGLLPEWNGKPLTLVLDHKNGDHTDNRLENLHWVCPNCNSQLTTTGFKGYRKYDVYGNKIDDERIPIEDPHDKENRGKIRCPKCGRLMTRQSEMCHVCFSKERSKKHTRQMPVNRDQLKELIRTKSFTDIGKQFNVSDNAIRKWCKKLDLPYSKEKIKSYTDSQWSKI